VHCGNQGMVDVALSTVRAVAYADREGLNSHEQEAEWQITRTLGRSCKRS
jgi:hypothetical protein